MKHAKALLSVLVLSAVSPGESQITNIQSPSLQVSPGTPLILVWSTNDWRFSIETTTNTDLKTGWNWLRTPRTTNGSSFFVTNAISDSCRFFRLACYPQKLCRSQLAQIGLAFRLSSGDLGYELYPFHVSTNLGGTKEFRAIGPDGFDTNAHYHLQVLSNYLSFPGLLVCPGDVQRAPAADFSALQSGNVTYQLRTGDPVTENNPSEILLVCPIDGNIVYADGTVPNYP